MERLTEKHIECINDFCYKTGCELYSNCPSLDRYNRLAAYEDTGLEPEDIKELCTPDICELATLLRRMILNGWAERLVELVKADEEGRLVELPCKVGDTVWVINSLWVSEYTVKSVFWDDVFFQFKAENENYAEDCRYFSFFDERIGKTVFLTREEAEKALEGGQDDAVT